MGEMKFKERGEQAEPEGTAEAEKVSFLLGVNSNDFIKCLVKPKIKVGTEVVTQGRNKAQVYSINISLIFYAYVKNCSILSLAIWEKKVLPENLCRLNLEKTK
jgi:myosin heavy subunit